jgi:hypothetical protein
VRVGHLEFPPLAISIDAPAKRSMPRRYILRSQTPRFQHRDRF